MFLAFMIHLPTGIYFDIKLLADECSIYMKIGGCGRSSRRFAQNKREKSILSKGALKKKHCTQPSKLRLNCKNMGDCDLCFRVFEKHKISGRGRILIRPDRFSTS